MQRFTSNKSLNSMRSKEGATAETPKNHNSKDAPRPSTASAPKPRRDVTEAEMANYSRLFRTFDVDRSGYLEFEELQLLLRCLGVNIDDETMESMRDEFDEDGNGILDFEEFVSFMIRSGELKHLRVVSDEEEEEHIRNPSKSARFMFDTTWRWVWDSVILFTTLYFMLRAPTDIWLGVTGVPHKLTPYEITLEILLIVVMVLDILIQGNTVVVRETGKAVDDLKETFLDYAQSYMTFDVLAAIPIDLVLVGFLPDYEVHPAFFVFRCAHFLKATRLKTLYSSKSATGVLTPTFVYLHYHISPILRSLFYFFFGVHWLTIGWLLTSFIVSGKTHSYVSGIYLVLYTLTTVGYGDVTVDRDGERLYCSFLFLMGAMVNGVVISQMSVFLQKANIDSERHDKMRETLAVLEHFEIPKKSQSEILSFQAHTLEHNLGSSHEALVSSLPGSIQDSLALFMKIKWISMVSMFEKASHECMVSLANSLVNIIFRPQEFIIIAGEMGREMYFLGHGIADVILPMGKWIATLRKGGFFGEIALLVEGAPRTASIKALTYCDVFRLERADFAAILNKFPAFQSSIQDEVEKRIEAFKKSNATSILPTRKRGAKLPGPPPEDESDSDHITQVPIPSLSGETKLGQSMSKDARDMSIHSTSNTSVGAFGTFDAQSVQSLTADRSGGERSRKSVVGSAFRDDLKKTVMDISRNTVKLAAHSPRGGAASRGGTDRLRPNGGWMETEGSGRSPRAGGGTGGFNPQRRRSRASFEYNEMGSFINFRNDGMESPSGESPRGDKEIEIRQKIRELEQALEMERSMNRRNEGSGPPLATESMTTRPNSLLLVDSGQSAEEEEESPKERRKTRFADDLPGSNPPSSLRNMSLHSLDPQVAEGVQSYGGVSHSNSANNSAKNTSAGELE